MLLERCQPGTSLRSEPEASQDEVIARMLKRIRSANSQSRGPPAIPPSVRDVGGVATWHAGAKAKLARRRLSASRSVDLREAIAAVPDRHPARNGPPRRQRPARRERAVAHD